MPLARTLLLECPSGVQLHRRQGDSPTGFGLGIRPSSARVPEGPHEARRWLSWQT